MTTDESQTNDRDSLLPTTHHDTTSNNTPTGGGGKYSSYKSIEFTLNDNDNDTTTTTTTSSSTPFFKCQYKNTTYRKITMGIASTILIAVFAMTTTTRQTPLTDIVFTPDNNSASSSSSSSSRRHHENNYNNNPTYLSLLSPSTTEGIPFPHIDRGAYGSLPASSIINTQLFGPHLRRSSSDTTTTTTNDNATSIESILTVPFPTGAFWTNFVVKPTSDRGYSYPVMVYPYGYKWNDEFLQVSYPPLRRLMDDISIRDIFNPDVTLGVMESGAGGGKRFIKSFDLLSVTLRFEGKQKEKKGEVTTEVVREAMEEGDDDNNTDESDDDDDSSETNAYWESYLVQGSPFITVKFHTMTPVIRALSTFHSFTCPPTTNDDCHETSSSSKDPFPTKQTLRGTKFILTTQENLTWILLASTPLTLSFNTLSRTTVTAIQPYKGVLRLALIPPPTPPKAVKPGTPFPRRYDGFGDGHLMESNGVKRLFEMGGEVYPVGGDVTYDFEDDEATVRFRYRTKSMTDDDDDDDDDDDESSDESLLMLALPHHTQVLSPSTTTLLQHPTQFDLTYQTIKGTMIPVVGSTWTWTESLTTIKFDDETTSLQNLERLDNDTLTLLREQVSKDGERVLPTLGENVYGYGKQIARLAQLVHIASVLPDDATSKDETTTSPLLDDIVSTLHYYLTTYLSGSNNPSNAVSDGLLYDANFGGIVSTNGLDDSSGDYGNGWYNDHHFHYGYLLYACAVLGRQNKTFVEEYEDYVDALFNDVAYNPPTADDDASVALFFPAARHKSWFDGHSYASGLFPFANGKSQESSSESVNCYYGAYLWSSVKLENSSSGKKREEIMKMQMERMNYARLLLATEIRSVKTYWHMNSVYNDYGKINDDKKDPTAAATTEAMTPASSSTSIYDTPPIYDPAFAKSFMCGNAAMMDVTVSTWFGTNPLYVHMINFMPITAITRELFDVEYVRKQFMGVIEPIYEKGGVEMAWRGYAICNQAMIDPDTAWKEALQLHSYELDQAISLSQVLYFISTMDDFHLSSSSSSKHQTDNTAADATLPPAVTTLPPIIDTNTAHNNNAQQTTTTTNSQSLCSSHEACKKSGLTGSCCPTTTGTFLDCCDK